MVRSALADGHPVLSVVDHDRGVEWHTLEPERPPALDGSALEVEAFPAGGDAPRYLGGSGGRRRGDRARPSATVAPAVSMTYVPASHGSGMLVLERLAASGRRAVDGTFRNRAELVDLGTSERTAG